MPNTNFDNPVKQPGNKLKVGGPFELPWNKDQLVGNIAMSFLLVEEVKEGIETPKTLQGIVSYDAKADLVLDEEAVPPVYRGTWTGTVDDPDDIPVGKYRAIGQAVLLRHLSDHQNDPPFFINLTWCVTRQVVLEGDEAAT